jgi:hypothetical protein
MTCSQLRWGLLCVLAIVLAGCSIDRVEWESTGYVVEEARHTLESEHHAVDPVVECIKREAAGAVWECRAHAGRREYECKVHVGIRQKIHSLHCEQKHEEAPSGEEAPAHDEEPAEEEAPAADEDSGH